MYHKSIWIPATQLKPKLTAGCAALAQLESATNKAVYDYLAFDPTTTEYCYANIKMPSDYSGGNIYAIFDWMHPATTTNFGVRWGVSGLSLGDNEASDAAQGTAGGVTDTGGTTYNRYASAVTVATTIAGTPAAGEFVHFNFLRAPTHADDNMAVDAYLLGVMIYYPVT